MDEDKALYGHVKLLQVFGNIWEAKRSALRPCFQSHLPDKSITIGVSLYYSGHLVGSFAKLKLGLHKYYISYLEVSHLFNPASEGK